MGTPWTLPLMLLTAHVAAGAPAPAEHVDMAPRQPWHHLPPAAAAGQGARLSKALLPWYPVQ